MRRRRRDHDRSAAGSGRLEQALQRGLHGGRGALAHELLDAARRRLARRPLAVRALDPEHVLEAVGDGEAAVRRALGHHALGPEVHREVGPVVLALAERVPGGLQLLLPGLVLRDEPPERREVDDDAVVEVRLPERRDALHLVEEGAQLLDEAPPARRSALRWAAVAPSRSSLVSDSRRRSSCASFGAT